MIATSKVRVSGRLLGTVLLSFAGTVALSGLAGCSGPTSASDAEDVARITEMYEDYHKDFPAVRGITAQELMELQAQGDIVLVDVREPEEQQVSMIPGAITAEDFEAGRETYRDKRVVVYCTIGARSGRYADKLVEEGVDAVNLEGSILSWTHAGGSLVGPNGPTNDVHVYGPTWNLAADGYHAVW